MKLEGWLYVFQLLAGLDLMLSSAGLLGVAWRGGVLGLLMAALGVLLIASIPLIWLGSRRAEGAVALFAALGLAAWAVLAWGRYAVGDLIGIALLGASLALLAAWKLSRRREARQRFHPLDYPVYG
jgi:hypothetical protein